MNSPLVSLLAADAVLVAHVCFVLFIIVGLVVVCVGGALDWRFVRNPIFRLLHLAAIVVVTLQSWLGVVCPLTTLENHLRRTAGEIGYQGTFISHWLQTMLYYEAPAWVFVACYSVFGLLVIASWFFVQPFPFVGDRSRNET